VPVVIGAKGVERVLEVALSCEEKNLFDASIQAVRDLTQDVINLKNKKTG
jgi:malate/lactate dehydrogenase